MAGLRDALDRLRQALDGGSSELHRDDLLRHAERGILELRSYGAAGRELFPAAVLVRIDAASASPDVIEAMVDEPSFARDLAARISNRLADPGRAVLPVVRYQVQAGETDAVQVAADESPASYRLVIDGGDRDGQRLPLPPSRRVLRVGRGRWHGRTGGTPNDLVLCDQDSFVSRAAAVLERSGAGFVVRTCDQGDCLAVLEAGGGRVRPAMTAAGKARFEPGDQLELNDGADRRILIRLEAPCEES